jgi:hypothetical protein
MLSLRPSPRLPGPALPCPECLMDPLRRGDRIGNNRRCCGTCNRFALRVRQEVAHRLRELHPEEHRALVRSTERELFVEFGRDWLAARPTVQEQIATISDGWPPVDTDAIAAAERALDDRTPPPLVPVPEQDHRTADELLDELAALLLHDRPDHEETDDHRPAATG